MQGVDSGNERPFGRRPARRIGAFVHGGANLFLGQTGGLREGRYMHAPLVLAARQRASAVDDNLAFPQRERTAIEEAPARNFSQARGLDAITRNSINGGAPRMMRSNWLWISAS